MDCLTLAMHHSDKFVDKAGCNEHVEGNVAYDDFYDTNSLCYDKLQDIMKNLCKDNVVRLFYKVYIPSDNQGLRLVYKDSQH